MAYVCMRPFVPQLLHIVLKHRLAIAILSTSDVSHLAKHARDKVIASGNLRPLSSCEKVCCDTVFTASTSDCCCVSTLQTSTGYLKIWGGGFLLGPFKIGGTTCRFNITAVGKETHIDQHGTFCMRSYGSKLETSPRPLCLFSRAAWLHQLWKRLRQWDLKRIWSWLLSCLWRTI